MKLPKDWEVHSLRDFIEKLESGVSVNAEDIPVSNGSPAVLKVGCVSGGVFYPQENKRILESEIHRAKLTVRKGTVIISRSNTQELVGECAYIKQDYPNLYLSDKTWQTIFKPGAPLDARWLGYLLSSPGVKQKLGNLSNGTSGSMKNISKESFLSLEVITPPPEEQSAIADFLDVLDRNIEQTDKLIAAKARIKRGLVQQLLSGGKRFAEFGNETWQEAHFGDFLMESRIPGSNGVEAKKITVKLYGKGVVEKTEKLLGSANTKYHIRRAGQFIYSKLDFLNGAFGIIPQQLDGYESTLDLPAFDIDERLDPLWLFYFVSRSHFYKRYANAAEGGRKARRVQPDEFLKTKARFPSIEEQRRIAAVLNACDKEITLLKQQLAALKRQKRGLMQKLLTGQIRLFSETAL
jgi:type I restriction enzyme S subunit